jgi:F-type H+-transporting ATPase subunit delta
MKGTKAAGRYAQSLLSLALETSQVEEVKKDMELFTQTVAESHELELLLQSPIIKTDLKQKSLTAIFEKSVSELTIRFFEIVTAKGRESILPTIAVSFIKLYESHYGVVRAEVTSASALNDAQRDALKKNLSGLGKTVVLSEGIDASLIGGLKIKVGDQRIDATLRKKLNEIKVDILK